MFFKARERESYGPINREPSQLGTCKPDRQLVDLAGPSLINYRYNGQEEMNYYKVYCSPLCVDYINYKAEEIFIQIICRTVSLSYRQLDYGCLPFSR
jgi:hypothetical protein